MDCDAVAVKNERVHKRKQDAQRLFLLLIHDRQTLYMKDAEFAVGRIAGFNLVLPFVLNAAFRQIVPGSSAVDKITVDPH